MILFLHHRYRVDGGEERAVGDLLTVVREQLGEPAELLMRASDGIGAARAGAGMLGGGLSPEQVGTAVRRGGARIVHAHNLNPTFGWRALAAARAAGARVVLHLHQYRLVCAIGVSYRNGHECLECHGRDTRPGVHHRCRGSLAESLVYAGALALWQRRLLAQADVVVVPSAFAADRLRALGAPLAGPPRIVPNVVEPVPEPAAAGPVPPRSGALVVSRLAPEKGVEVAIDACARAGMVLTIAGEGPEREALTHRAAAGAGEVRFLGRVGDAELAALRARAAVAVVPSRSAETFGLAAGEAMAHGLPVAASRVGALPELVPADWLVPPGDPAALAVMVTRLARAPGAGDEARVEVARHASPAVVARALTRAYAEATARP